MAELAADVRYGERRSRLTTAFRAVLLVPHAAVVAVWALVAEVVAVPQWFAIVFTGRRRRGLFDLQWQWLAYAGRVAGYEYLLFDEYPRFGTDPGDVPMVCGLAYEEDADRLTNGLRVAWVLPAALIGIGVSIAVAVAVIGSWFAVVVTGRLPRELFTFVLEGLRYLLQLGAYGLLMTDTYPQWGSGVPMSAAAPSS